METITRWGASDCAPYIICDTKKNAYSLFLVGQSQGKV